MRALGGSYAAIAVPYKLGWRGVIHVSSPEPRHLGRFLWRQVTQGWFGDVAPFVPLVISRAPGWHQLVDADVSCPPVTFSPSTISPLSSRSRAPVALSHATPVVCGCPYDSDRCQPSRLGLIYGLSRERFAIAAALGTGRARCHQLVFVRPWEDVEPDWADVEAFISALDR